MTRPDAMTRPVCGGRLMISPERNADRAARYREGLSDKAMARAEGVSEKAIRNWRLARDLAPNFAPSKGEDPISERAARMLLYQLGWGDVAIARARGVTRNPVARWRRRLGLPANYRRGENQDRAVSFDVLLVRLRRAVGRALPRDIADDAVADMFAALLSGELPISEIEAKARRYGNKVLDRYASKFGPRSLDEEIGEDGFSMMDMIRDDRSSSWLEEMGATVW